MANCPKCNNRLPFLKAGLLSRVRNRVECRSCNTILEADTSLSSISGLIGGLGGALVIWNKEIFGNQSLSLIMAIATSVVLIIVAMLIQNRFIKLKIVENKDH
ncbi:MAG: hypothetical protein H2058_14855 [Muricauda sp.]|nr:hypothetical protein [Allomuricauda sp.]MBA4746531.1 hypothetical protein [Allomuricauda sp.]